MTRAGDVMRRGGGLVGLLTEGDLIARRMPRHSLRWWEVVLQDAEALPAEYRKAFGTSVGEVMTPTRMSVSPDAPLEEVATLMRAHSVRAVPVVVAHDELVGVVTSAEVIEGLADRSEARRCDGIRCRAGARNAAAHAGKALALHPEHSRPGRGRHRVAPRPGPQRGRAIGARDHGARDPGVPRGRRPFPASARCPAALRGLTVRWSRSSSSSRTTLRLEASSGPAC